MGIGEPLRAGVVEVGEGALLQLLGRGLVAGNGTLGIAWDRLVYPLDPFGRVEPAVAQFHKTAGRRGDGQGAGIVCIVGSGNVGGQPLREGIRLKGSGWRVARIVSLAKPCSEPQRPGLVKPAVQNAESSIVVAGDSDQSAVRVYTGINPDKQPVFGDAGSGDVATQAT